MANLVVLVKLVNLIVLVKLDNFVVLVKLVNLVALVKLPCALFRHLKVKKGPMVCFVHFGLEMCFSPQRRALFRQLNFKKRSEADVFCTF